MRAAALRICEDAIEKDRQYDSWIKQASIDSDPNVVIQTVLSVSRGNHPKAEQIIEQIEQANRDNHAVQDIIAQIRARIAAMIAERKKLEELRRRNKLLAESVVRGKLIYSTLCVTCHGENGQGMPSPDNKGELVAPSLVGSPRVTGHKERLTRIMLHGLMGKIDDKTYTAGLMLPMGSNTNQWIGDVATYIRNSWGNKADLIETSDVARIREESKDRIGPWTLRELTYFDPPPLEDRGLWKLSASHNENKTSGCIDGQDRSRWDTGTTQKPGMWIGIELPERIRLMSLRLDTRGSSMDYPRGYSVQVSADGTTWSDEVAKGVGDDPVTEIEVDSPEPIRFIRITQTGRSPNKFWSIHELGIKGLSLREPPPVPLAQELSERPVSELTRLAREKGDSTRGAKIFFNPALSCAKCHEPDSGERLGPDLAAKRKGVDDAFIVHSVLDPSKDIRKEFKQFKVATEAGLLIVGFVINETDDVLVLREPAGGKIIELDQDDVLATKPA
ncbi:MAG: discoidin domain-containing protein, partial [Planctomycetota bacterium]